VEPLILRNAELLDPEAQQEPGWAEAQQPRWVEALAPRTASVRVEGGRIAAILEADARAPDAREVDLGGRRLAPGFIDLHFHGELIFAGPNDLHAALDRTAASLLRHGTTGFLATTVAWGPSALRAFMTQFAAWASKVRHDGATALGLHLEGPWINAAAAGAQPGAAICDFDPASGTDTLDIAGEFLRMVTLAPECPGSDALLDALSERRVIASLGHSLAGPDEIDAAMTRGMTHVTHLFNAMGSIHHRAPGAAGYALSHDGLTCDLICDGVHLHPAMVRTAARAKPGRVMLITDNVSPPANTADFGAGPVLGDGDALRLPDGTLAGSTLQLDRALRNVQAFGAMSRLEAVAAATLLPARLLGLEHERGTLRVGARADFAILDADDRVVETWIEGRRAWSATDEARPGSIS